MITLRARAEVLSAPFLSPGAFASAATSVGAPDPWVRDRLNLLGRASETSDLWRHYWPDPREDLAQSIRAHAHRILRHDGDHIALAEDNSDPGREVLAWRSLSLRVPAGLWTAAATPAHARALPKVQVLPRWLVPNGRLAHLHVHWNAAFAFEVLWTWWMARGRHPDGDLPPVTGFEGTWGTWLDCARIARLALADEPNLTPTGDDWARLAAAPWQHQQAIVAEALLAISTGQLPAAWARRRGSGNGLAELRHAAARRLHWNAPQRQPGSQDDIWRCDPLDDGGDWPEGQLLARWFRRTTPDPRTPLFIQYLRIKCRLYAHLVQDPTSPGLAAFADTFDRLRPYRQRLAGLRAKHLDEGELHDHLAAIEIRQDPKGSRQVAKLCRDLAGQQGREWGAVLHLLRDDSRDGVAETWFAKYHRIAREGRQYVRSLRADGKRLRWIRGIDLAGNEREGPLWIALPTLRRIREEARQVGQEFGIRTMGLTLHAGEDFGHLASGLRAVHEPIAWQLLQPGDRLGHAAALACEPAQWAKGHPRVAMPRWVRLLDLAWLLAVVRGAYLSNERCVRAAELPPDSEGRLAESWRREVAALGADPTDAVAFHETLGRPDTVSDWLDPDSTAKGLARFFAAACKRSAKRDWSQQHLELFQTIEVRTAQEAELLQAVRRRLIAEVASRQLAIEVNPTSNLVIGGLQHPLQQRMFALHPLQERLADSPEAGLPTLPVTLSADDPLTLATSLADEIAYAWTGIVVGMGEEPAVASAWLEEASANSWRWRFTLPNLHAGAGLARYRPQ